jgi:hypothetical protein
VARAGIIGLCFHLRYPRLAALADSDSQAFRTFHQTSIPTTFPTWSFCSSTVPRSAKSAMPWKELSAQLGPDRAGIAWLLLLLWD